VEPANIVRDPRRDKLRANWSRLRRNRPGIANRLSKEDRTASPPPAFPPRNCGCHPDLPDALDSAFRLTNTARICADQGPIELLEKQATPKPRRRAETAFASLKTTANAAAHFEGKPSAEIRAE